MKWQKSPKSGTAIPLSPTQQLDYTDYSLLQMHLSNVLLTAQSPSPPLQYYNSSTIYRHIPTPDRSGSSNLTISLGWIYHNNWGHLPSPYWQCIHGTAHLSQTGPRNSLTNPRSPLNGI